MSDTEFKTQELERLLSEGKITLPGRKQVYRFKYEDGNYAKDVIALADEKLKAEPLLIKVMENGKITYELPSLNEIRSAAKQNLSNLPEKYKKITNPPTYPVELSETLEDLTQTLTRKLTTQTKAEKTKSKATHTRKR